MLPRLGGPLIGLCRATCRTRLSSTAHLRTWHRAALLLVNARRLVRKKGSDTSRSRKWSTSLLPAPPPAKPKSSNSGVGGLESAVWRGIQGVARTICLDIRHFEYRLPPRFSWSEEENLMRTMFKTAITGTLAIFLVGEFSCQRQLPNADISGGRRQELSSRSRGKDRLSSGQPRFCWLPLKKAPMTGSLGSGK